MILVSFGQVLAGGDTSSPLQIGSRLQLFLDDYLIESMVGVRLQLHTPRQAGIVMNHDKPWEGTTPYYRAPHIYLAFPKRYVQWRTMHPDVSGSGVSEGVFMSSRDGVRWDRRFMEAFVRPGRDPRSWVHRTNMIAAGVVPTADDEISIYVARDYISPSAHLERMVLRTDGFVSASADYSGGELLTKPLLFQDNNLVLNFATSAAGSIHLEIQDAAALTVRP